MKFHTGFAAHILVVADAMVILNKKSDNFLLAISVTEK
jgi:hypothetical protein